VTRVVSLVASPLSPQHEDMLTPRLITLLVVAAAALAAVIGLAVARPDHATSPVARPVPLSPAATASPGDPAASAQVTPAPPPDDGDLEAARAVKRFCDLVDAGSLGAAGRLLAGPWVWPREELARIARFRFISAQVQPGSVADGLVLMVRARARLRGPSPLHDGVNTLFFTLGRDGTTGGWLVTAVTSSP
jgi:hypothetical protein